MADSIFFFYMVISRAQIYRAGTVSSFGHVAAIISRKYMLKINGCVFGD